MKNLLVMILVLLCFTVHAQKWGHEFGISYLYANPIGGMGRIIQQGNGVSLNYGLVIPNGRFAFGVEINLAQYGHDKSRQEYTMDDGTVAPMDVVVTNSFSNIMTYSRFYLSTNGRVRPFITGKIGYTGFDTDLGIYDPDEKDQCKPIDSDILYSDGTMVAGVGAGVKLDIASVFRKLRTGRFYLESSVNFTQGGQVRYMSEDADANHPYSNSPDSDHVMATFLNTNTQIVHKHHVGHLYKSPLQITELRAGFSMRISR